MSCAEQALFAYRRAYEIDKREISAFQGLAECYLQMKDNQRALAIAK